MFDTFKGSKETNRTRVHFGIDKRQGTLLGKLEIPLGGSLHETWTALPGSHTAPPSLDPSSALVPRGP